MADTVFPMLPNSSAPATGDFRRYASAFPDPFFDYASTQMPRSLYDVLRWSEYLWMVNGVYRTACQRIVRYFLTKVELEDASDDEKEKYEDFLTKQVKILDVLGYIGDDWMCFHGDVNAVTRDGVFKLRELAGHSVDVLSQDGVYRPAEFKSFGRQELLEVELSDGRTVLATPEHQWVVKNCSDQLMKVPTTQLTQEYRIPRVVAPRPPQNDDFYEGVRHGFTFGDGSIYNKDRKTPMAEATFFGDKDAEPLKYFEGHGNAPVPDDKTQSVTVFGLPAHYKQLPPNDSSASYWHGFVCGVLAADGSVDVYGCTVLMQQTKATLELMAAQLPRIGMVAGPVRSQQRTTKFVRENGRIDVYDSDMHFVTLFKQHMLPQDFLSSKRRERFEQSFAPTKYGEFIGIRSVKKTGIVDEVFCCVEMETHTFVIDNGILTGNCYGNSFTSIRVPFRRYLRCPKCYTERTLDSIEYKFEDWKFTATCAKCGFRGEFERIDRRSVEQDKIRIIRWSPHNIRLLYHPVSHEVTYYWVPPADFKREIKRGNKFFVATTPWEIIEAIKKDQWFKFNPGVIYHVKEETLAGIRNAGWGIPRILSNFKQAWYVQVLKRYNEAIGLDYIIPFRVITPAKSTGSGEVDPLFHMNAGSFMQKVLGMVQHHRRDPASWNTLPFPVEYQALSGEGKDLAPTELLTEGTNELLDSMGFPAEMFRGSLQVQAAPMALRLFERTWTHLVSALNGWINWFFDSVTDVLNWEELSGRLQPVTLAEDIERKQIQLQLAAAQQISKQTAYAPFGVDWREEVRRMFEEEKYFQDESSRFQTEQAAAQQIEQTFAQAEQAAAMPAGGMPGAMGPPSAMGPAMPGGGQPAGGTTPADLMSQAEQVAMRLLGMPASARKHELLLLRKSDETLHALVIACLEKLRGDASREGQFQALQQQYGAQAG